VASKEAIHYQLSTASQRMVLSEHVLVLRWLKALRLLLILPLSLETP
jgi:hypothetical protein